MYIQKVTGGTTDINSLSSDIITYDDIYTPLLQTAALKSDRVETLQCRKKIVLHGIKNNSVNDAVLGLANGVARTPRPPQRSAPVHRV